MALLSRGLVQRFLCVSGVVILTTLPAAGQLNLGPEEIVQAAGADIIIPGYGVPCLFDWDADGLNDLIVGEGGNANPQKVRVYLNVGTAQNPQFGDWFYVQANGMDMTYSGPGCGDCLKGTCLGLFPRPAYWDGDALFDLVVGQSDGTVRVYTNIGTPGNPNFDMGVLVQVGMPGSKVPLDFSVGQGRATPVVVDWNADGRKDLVVGCYQGKMLLLLNEGSDTAPDFRTVAFAQEDGADLLVPTGRSSPHVFDADGDGRKDLLVGNTEGQLLLYMNVGTDAWPTFSGYTLVEADGVPIDLAGTPRSRPFVCDWTGDGRPDVLIGCGDLRVRLYQGVPEPATWLLLTVGAGLLRRKRSRARARRPAQ